jgi:hypothetical protein
VPHAASRDSKYFTALPPEQVTSRIRFAGGLLWACLWVAAHPPAALKAVQLKLRLVIIPSATARLPSRAACVWAR